MESKLLSVCFCLTLCWSCATNNESTEDTSMTANVGDTMMRTGGTTMNNGSSTTNNGSSTTNNGSSTMNNSGTLYSSPEELSNAYNGVSMLFNQSITGYCGMCASSTFCDDLFMSNDFLSVEDATCILGLATPANLEDLSNLFACQSMVVSEFQACLNALNSCEDEAFLNCSSIVENQSCSLADDSFSTTVGVQCFGQEPPFMCANGQEVPGEYVCDFDDDCGDGSDEVGDCPPGFMCANGEEINPLWVCDSDDDCGDNSDEEADCPEPFICPNGEEIPGIWVCDDFDDCGDNADEQNCN